MNANAADLLSVALVCAVSALLTLLLLRKSGSDERRVLWASLVMHLVFSQVLLFMQSTLYRESDIWFYHELSTPFLALMRADPMRFVPEVTAATLHLPNELFEEPSTTTSMVTLTALGRLASFDSLWAMFAASSFLTFLGKWGIYAVFRQELRSIDRRWLGMATMCIPSVVFWTSGVVKEAYAIVGLGALFYGAWRLVRGHVFGLVLILFGAVVVGLFKPYILFPFAVGGAAWVVFERSKRVRSHAPIYLLAGLVLGGGLVVLLSVVFPDFSPTHLAEQTADMQARGAYAGGGSYYEIGGADVAAGPGAQLLIAPLGLLTALFRPFVWEVRSATSFIAASETLLMTVLLVRSLVRGKGASLRGLFELPAVVFAVMFVLIGGAAIGLATTNFGTLSRYRVPIMPFYAVTVAYLTSYSEALVRARRRPVRIPVTRRAHPRSVTR